MNSENSTVTFNNSTDNLSATITGMISLPNTLTNMEMEYKIVQLIFCYVPLLISIAVIGRLVYVLKTRLTLQNPGNILVAAFVISDGFVILDRTLFITFILTGDKDMMSIKYVYMQLFLSSFLFGVNLFYLTVSSVEKLLYINFVYLHNRVFCSVERTFIYLSIGSGVVVLTRLDILMFRPDVRIISPGIILTDDFTFSAIDYTILGILQLFLIVVNVGSSVKILQYSIKQGRRFDNKHIVDRQFWRTLLARSNSTIFPKVWITLEITVYKLALMLNCTDLSKHIILMTLMVMRIFNLFFLLCGNRRFKNAFLCRKNPLPVWLNDVQKEIITCRLRQTPL